MSAQNDPNSVLLNALYRILKSVARVALRYGLSAGAINDLVRRAFVEAAESTLLEQGKKPLTSRLCTITGLYRKEIVRIKELPPIENQTMDDRYNRSTRVITGWLRDKRFHTKAGRPAVLNLDGKHSFNELVRRYSGDMTPRSMLEELLRLQAIELGVRNTVKLNAHAYIPQSSEVDTMQILGTDTADLIDTINHNIGRPADQRRFQRKVMYVHIPERHVDSFRHYAARESQALLEKLDRWLANHDTEKQSSGSAGSRIGLGIYLITQDNSPLPTSDGSRTRSKS
jgi:hypothetical protein